MAEEEKRKSPCIQDRLQEVVRNIQTPKSFILITIISITYIYLISYKQFNSMNKINILFTVGTLFFAYYQGTINRSLLKLEKERNNPRLIANVPSSSPLIFIENQGGGMAWGCEITVERLGLEGRFEELIEKIYPWSGEQFNIPEEWYNDTFDLFIGIEYYTEEDMNSDSLRKWARIFKKINPYMF